MIQFERIVLINFGSWKALDFPLANQGLVLLTGETGSGKSTIFRALYWALFGKTPEGHKVSDLKRHKSNWGYVRVAGRKVTQGTDQPFLVTRYLNHPQWKNKVRLSGPSIPHVDADSLRQDVDPMIQTVLGFGPELFAKVFYFVQRDTKRFSSMTDFERKLFLESLSHGELLKQLEMVARIRVRELEYEIHSLLSRARVREETFEELKKQAERSDKETLATIADLKAQEVLAKNDLKQFRERHGQDIGRWYEEAADLTSQMSFYDRAASALKRVSGLCPVCTAAISPALKKERLALFETTLEHLEAKHQECEKNLTKYDDLVERVSSVQMAIAKERDKLSVKPIDIPDTILRVSMEEDARRHSLEEDCTYAQFWVKGFGPMGLRAILLKRTLGTLTKYLSGFLAMLHPHLEVRLALTDNRVVFHAPSGRSLASLSGGERQALDLAVGLALRQVLEGSTPVVDSLMLDEPFEGLDASLQRSAQRLLDAIPKKSVYLITHTDFLAHFNKRYLVRKHQGISALSLED